MLLIDSQPKILLGNIMDHQTHYLTALNLNPDIKYESTINTHCLKKSKNHMSDSLLPPTACVSCTTTSSSDVCITDKMNINPEIFPPTAVSFPTKTTKHYKTLSLCRPHYPIHTIRNQYCHKENLCPRNFHRSYDFIHLW